MFTIIMPFEQRTCICFWGLTNKCLKFQNYKHKLYVSKMFIQVIKQIFPSSKNLVESQRIFDIV